MLSDSAADHSKIHPLFVVGAGFLMGTADLVPGVSGGTIALLLGIYPALLGALGALGAGFREGLRSVPWRFLGLLALGLFGALITLGKLFSGLLNDSVGRQYLFALFFGLVLASAVICGRRVERWTAVKVLMTVMGTAAALAVCLSGPPSTLDEEGYDVPIQVSDLSITLANYDGDQGMLLGVSRDALGAMLAKQTVSSDASVYSRALRQQVVAGEVATEYSHGLDLTLVGCGFLAVSAMLLPGISGSYVMLAIGKYPQILGAWVDCLDSVVSGSLNVPAALAMASLLIGIAGGALIFASTVGYLYNRFREGTTAALTGMVLGALPAVWPFWSYEYQLAPLRLEKGPQLMALQPYIPVGWDAHVCGVLGVAVVGFLGVLILNRFAD